MSTRVLHISNDFPNSSLYKQLVIHLDTLDIKQTVYSAVRTKQEAQFSPQELNPLDINISNILQPYDRLLYRNKIRKITNDVTTIIDYLRNIDLIHAHTLYSDGGVALKLKERYDIPYLVAIRNTDLNAYQKFRPDLRIRRNKILREAKKIVFISPAYEYRLLKLLKGSLKEEIRKKIVVIPNGLDPLFSEQDDIKNKNSSRPLKLLYVGNFKKLKNIPILIKSAKVLYEQENIKLTLVGGGGEDHTKVKKMINSKKYPFVEYEGKVEDRNRLRKIYASHDIFVMTSDRETFGLVYIEALSQGLPIVYTKGEGIDGYFEQGTVCEAVTDPQSPDEIASKIKDIADRLNSSLKKRCIQEVKKFNWNSISKKYCDIYKSIYEQ